MNHIKRLVLLGTAAVIISCGIVFPEKTYAAENTKLIALTFDDGPNTTTTNEVLDVLEQYNAKASFFLIGNNINDKSAASVKRAYDMGCEIDNHSKSHPNMGSMSAEEIKTEVNYVDEKIMEITGEKSKFFRPPYIDTSQTMYDAIDIPFICGIDCQDYIENATAQERANYIINGAKDGVIVLLHDAAGNNKTVEALKIAMPILIEEGYEFVTLTELFERQGEMPKEDMIYTYVAKYPCKDYIQYENIFTGIATGDTSWSGWGKTAVLDGNTLKELGSDYAIEVEYESILQPVLALQKWSGETTLWATVQPFYYNGNRACFLSEDILKVLMENDVDYTDLDRISIIPYGGTMTLAKADILVKKSSEQEASGDINNDGEFNVADLTLLQNWLLVKETTLENWEAGDYTKDGKLDVFDTVLMRRSLIK